MVVISITDSWLDFFIHCIVAASAWTYLATFSVELFRFDTKIHARDKRSDIPGHGRTLRESNEKYFLVQSSFISDPAGHWKIVEKDEVFCPTNVPHDFLLYSGSSTPSW